MTPQELEKYRRKDQSASRKPIDIEKYRRKSESPIEQNSPQTSNKEQSQYHPIIRKIAEQLVKHPKLNKGVEKASEYLELPGAFAGGAVQQGGDMFASLANLINKPINKVLGTNYHQAHPKIREQFDPGLFNDIAFGAGELTGGLVGGGGVGTGKGILQAVQKLARSGGLKGLGGDVLKGVGTGYALGEMNDEGEGRGIGALLGGIAQPLSSVTNRGITNRVLKDRESELARHGKTYEDIFNAGKKSGVQFNPRNLSSIPSKQIEGMIDRLPKDHRKIVEEFLKNPTIESSHKLQSDLGKYVRSIEGDKRFKTNSLPLNLQRAYEAANETRTALQNDIAESFGRKGLIEESLKYPAVTKSYAKNVAPYDNKAIGDVIAGNKHPEKLAERLRNDEQFMIAMGEKYPEIALNKHLPKLGAGTAGVAGIMAALLGYPKISHAKEKKKEPYLVTSSGYKVYD